MLCGGGLDRLELHPVLEADCVPEDGVLATLELHPVDEPVLA